MTASEIEEALEKALSEIKVKAKHNWVSTDRATEFCRMAFKAGVSWGTDKIIEIQKRPSKEKKYRPIYERCTTCFGFLGKGCMKCTDGFICVGHEEL